MTEQSSMTMVIQLAKGDYRPRLTLQLQPDGELFLDAQAVKAFVNTIMFHTGCWLLDDGSHLAMKVIRSDQQPDEEWWLFAKCTGDYDQAFLCKQEPGHDGPPHESSSTWLTAADYFFHAFRRLAENNQKELRKMRKSQRLNWYCDMLREHPEIWGEIYPYVKFFDAPSDDGGYYQVKLLDQSCFYLSYKGCSLDEPEHYHRSGEHRIFSKIEDIEPWHFYNA